VPHGAKLGVDVVEDSEFSPTHVSPRFRFSLRLWWQELRHCLAGNQSGKLFTSHLRKRIQIAHLFLNILTGTVKPEALSSSSMNPQRTTDGISVPAGLQGIVLGEDLDSFLPTPFDRYAQLKGKTANVNTAVPGWERLRHEYPEMSAPMAVLKG
jgi:hypothetical protein